MVTSNELAESFKYVAQAIHNRRDYLCELDSHAGDGDHGISMDLGWQAISNVESDGVPCAQYLRNCGKDFITAVGASIGPLYGTAFLRAAKACDGKDQLSVQDVIEMFHAAVAGMGERGGAKLGDKTLLDTLLPVDSALADGVKQNLSLNTLLEKVVSEAERGMESTAELVSRIGRSSRLGERSRGQLDPGAASAYVVIEALVTYLLPLAENVGSIQSI
ncbi:dihydroxyacetone kinase subunit DhaL [Alicyclobacillus dauci]|uniref:Dihydroxyacetone kinase subunit DhaL n=1 Tax=Alicyclobacillus dauci TaxID=1475485 RepID=A0ABY6Z7J8_9BACL|nr:dihydroxyacetone kinase subunit DhaL [Alicyclobacillus dauci]WAH38862.1 dihydroxyacetone kinase subunit DhaL [Alicyclobacillus dauci]